MNIQLATKDSDFENINQFFGKMWKEEFDLDRYDRLEEYKKSIVLFYEEKAIIIASISVIPYEGSQLIGRFGVKKSHRGKGLGKQLFHQMEEEIQNRNIKTLKVFAEINKVPMYEKFGFVTIGEVQKIGNTESVMMEKQYT